MIRFFSFNISSRPIERSQQRSKIKDQKAAVGFSPRILAFATAWPENMRITVGREGYGTSIDGLALLESLAPVAVEVVRLTVHLRGLR